MLKTQTCLKQNHNRCRSAAQTYDVIIPPQNKSLIHAVKSEVCVEIDLQIIMHQISAAFKILSLIHI